MEMFGAVCGAIIGASVAQGYGLDGMDKALLVGACAGVGTLLGAVAGKLRKKS